MRIHGRLSDPVAAADFAAVYRQLRGRSGLLQRLLAGAGRDQNQADQVTLVPAQATEAPPSSGICVPAIHKLICTIQQGRLALFYCYAAVRPWNDTADDGLVQEAQTKGAAMNANMIVIPGVYCPYQATFSC